MVYILMENKQRKLIFIFEIAKKILFLKIKKNYLIKMDKTLILGRNTYIS